MKKLIPIFAILFVIIIVFAIIFLPDNSSVTDGTLSIRPSRIGVDWGVRIITSIDLPLTEGVGIVEQGTLIIPQHLLGDGELTLDTEKAIKSVKTEPSDSNYKHTFSTVLVGIPDESLTTPIYARGYMIYENEQGYKSVMYGDEVFFDAYSVAEKALASDGYTRAEKRRIRKLALEAFDKYLEKVEVAQQGMLTITSPAEGEQVYPYYDDAKSYLFEGEALAKGKSATIITDNAEKILENNFEDFAKPLEHRTVYPCDYVKPIVITWNSKYDNVASYTVAYSTSEDFIDAKFATACAEQNSVSLYNLYKATNYYVKVIANLTDGSAVSTDSYFYSTDLGPRIIFLEGAYNIRDIGGYMTNTGKRTLQGMIYRGGQIDDIYYNGNWNDTNLTAYGKYVASEELGIRLDFDFRCQLLESPIPNADIRNLGVAAYRLALDLNHENLRRVIPEFANINNYPIFFHCQGGADRTGTVSYLLNALLGVNELDVARDYEFTTFTIYDLRAIDTSWYMNTPEYKFHSTLLNQEGATLQEKTENYLLGIGITPEVIANIRSIMLDGVLTHRDVIFPSEVRVANTDTLKITVNAYYDDIASLTLNGEKVDWYEIAGGIAVNIADFPESVKNGEVSAEITFTDGESWGDTFLFDDTRAVTFPDLKNDTFYKTYDIKVGALDEDIKELYIAGEKVDFTHTITGISIPIVTLPELTDGKVDAKVVFTDGEEIAGTFNYTKMNYLLASDYIDFSGNDFITLDSEENTTITTKPIGYGDWVRVSFDATYSKRLGDHNISIGSYGIRIKGGAIRFQRINTEGVSVESNPYERLQGNAPVLPVSFKEGSPKDLLMKVELTSDTEATIYVKVMDRFTHEESYLVTVVAPRLTEGEISHENASLVIKIGSTAIEEDTLTVYAKR